LDTTELSTVPAAPGAVNGRTRTSCRPDYPTAAIESIALCTQDDEVLRPLLEAHAGCRVVIAPRTAFSIPEV